MRVLRHVSLFSGIGGIDLAAEQAGFQTVLCAESDKACQAVLRRHWPQVPIVDDVRCVDGSINADIISGGFPCQDFSVAGRRAGLAGERSGIWWEFQRILAAVRPTWTLIENVPGLLSSNRGRDMGAILGALGDLGYGYAYRVLDAQYCGVPQRRRRVFIVGCLGDVRRAAAVLLEPESLCGNTAPGGEAREAIADALTSRAGSSGDYDGTGRYVVAAPLTSSAGHHGHSSPRGDGADNLVAAFHGRHSADMDLDFTIEGTPPLRTGHTGLMLLEDAAVRRLTPTECERLQGFPDGWTEGHSDSQRYRMLGNAVAVPVAEWILRRIGDIERGTLPNNAAVSGALWGMK